MTLQTPVTFRPAIAPSGAALPVPAPHPGRPGATPATGTIGAPAHRQVRPRLFIDAQHGLGNRLRAIASAATIAEATGRELVIVWQPDHHCQARFTDLFRYPGPVIETAFPGVFARAGGLLYNYMEIEPGAQKDAPILDEPARHRGGDVYVRSAYRLVSPHRDITGERRFLQALRPVQDIADMVRSVRRPNQVAAHVRMAGGPGFEHLSYEAAENWLPEGHARIAHWRARSHARHFMARLDALVAAGEAETIFLAADLPDTYARFADRYGPRLAWLPRRHYDRSAEQVRHALADMLLLGTAERLLGSYWSAFTDLAQRLSQRVVRTEFCGRDF